MCGGGVGGFKGLEGGAIIWFFRATFCVAVVVVHPTFYPPFLPFCILWSKLLSLLSIMKKSLKKKFFFLAFRSDMTRFSFPFFCGGKESHKICFGVREGEGRAKEEERKKSLRTTYRGVREG